MELLSWPTLSFIVWIMLSAWLIVAILKMVRSHDRTWMSVIILLAGVWVIVGFMSVQLGSFERAVNAVGGFIVNITGSYGAVAVGVILLLVGIGATFRDKAREVSRPTSRGATRVESS